MTPPDRDSASPQKHTPENGLFSAIGVELEYMLVDAESLSVRPIADELIKAETGAFQSEVERGSIAWSNELALHVVELKTNGPAPALHGLAELFSIELRHINARLAPLKARILPTGMHPWMEPHTETRLWPHEYNAVYEAFHRIFDCRGHGWSNLQSLHLNLPWSNDDEFARLHTAIRLLLPILPALAASSPFQDGVVTGLLDNRLHNYQFNCAKVPSITGSVVPEPITSPAEYDAIILQPIYRDLARLDPEGVLQDEWANARGAIARFQRQTIEIRVIDVQESPVADLAIAEIVWNVLAALVEERWSPFQRQLALSTEALQSIFLTSIAHGLDAPLELADYLHAFGFESTRTSARDLWRYLSRACPLHEGSDALNFILEHGCLAQRLLQASGPSPSRTRLAQVYRQVAACAHEGTLFGSR